MFSVEKSSLLIPLNILVLTILPKNPVMLVQLVRGGTRATDCFGLMAFNEVNVFFDEIDEKVKSFPVE